jgi:hypothetical protein
METEKLRVFLHLVVSITLSFAKVQKYAALKVARVYIFIPETSHGTERLYSFRVDLKMDQTHSCQ